MINGNENFIKIFLIMFIKYLNFYCLLSLNLLCRIPSVLLPINKKIFIIKKMFFFINKIA